MARVAWSARSGPTTRGAAATASGLVSMATTSRAVCGRSAGSLAIRRITTAESGAGVLLGRGGTASFTWAMAVATTDSRS